MLQLPGVPFPGPVLLFLLMAKSLGAAIGHRDYTATYVTSKVQAWCNDVKRLAEVADIFPHAAYAAFTHGLFSRWSYLMRTIPDITDFLQPLEDVIHQSFIPELFGHPPCSSIKRDLYALPVRLHGWSGFDEPMFCSQFRFP